VVVASDKPLPLDEDLFDADSPEAEPLLDEYVEEWLSENPWSGV
jgi:hypothetical protein